MSSLNTYWLCRAPGASTEGPFTRMQLQKMYENGVITADAIVCLKGEKEWSMIEVVMENPPPLPGSLSPMTHRAAALPEDKYEAPPPRDWAALARRAGYWALASFMVLGALWLLWQPIAKRSAELAQAQIEKDAADEEAERVAREEYNAKMEAFWKTPEGQAKKATDLLAQQRVAEQRNRDAEIVRKAYDAITPSAWDGSVTEAKNFIKRTVRDPSSVKYNQWRNFTNDSRHITTVDFTSTNGFGGPSRETWVFSFEKGSGKLMAVLADGKTIYDAE